MACEQELTSLSAPWHACCPLSTCMRLLLCSIGRPAPEGTQSNLQAAWPEQLVPGDLAGEQQQSVVCTPHTAHQQQLGHITHGSTPGPAQQASAIEGLLLEDQNMVQGADEGQMKGSSSADPRMNQVLYFLTTSFSAQIHHQHSHSSQPWLQCGAYCLRSRPWSMGQAKGSSSSSTDPGMMQVLLFPRTLFSTHVHHQHSHSSQPCGAYCSRSRTWSRGQAKGSSRAEPGMMPMWGAHQRSAPHHSWGMTSTRPRAEARAMPMRICSQRDVSRRIFCQGSAADRSRCVDLLTTKAATERAKHRNHSSLDPRPQASYTDDGDQQHRQYRTHSM